MAANRGCSDSRSIRNSARTAGFFISYTNSAGDNVLASYQVSGNADVADPGSAVIRLTVDQPYDNHNGGHIVFGADGYLYMGIGDGGERRRPTGPRAEPQRSAGLDPAPRRERRDGIRRTRQQSTGRRGGNQERTVELGPA